MPRKAKEKIDEIEDKSKKNVVKKSTAKASSEKKTSSKAVSAKKTTSRKSTLAKIIEEIAADPVEVKKSTKVKSADKSAKKSTKTKTTSTPENKSAKGKSASKTENKSTKTKSTDKSKKETPKKTSTKKESKKETTKKIATKKATAKKTATPKTQAKRTTTKKASNKSKKTVQVLEYYDLPYKYGNTVVRLLAQTPKTLFVYWEVSDSDIENFKKTYGDDFFNKTKPILIVHNLTLNKTTEIEINDFANCWYLNTDDTDCKFDIELARKYIDNNQENEENSSDYLYIAQSNDLQSPNNHILFEKIQEFVVFRNVTNDNVIKKNIKSFKFLKDIYKFYKDMYDEEVLSNPSSQFKF